MSKATGNKIQPKGLLDRFVIWLRWGYLTEHNKATVGGHVSEIEYHDKKGNIVGYWAYGEFDPHLPYRG